MTSQAVPFLHFVKQREEGVKVLKSIKEKSETLSSECSRCGERMERVYKDYNHYYNVGSSDKTIVVTNAPYEECPECGHIVLDVMLFAEIESSIDEEIFYQLNNRQEIPKKVDFSEFVK